MSKNIFNSIKATRPKRNAFDLSHDVKLSFEMGELVPTLCMECVPGDQIHLGGESLLRFAPMVAPVMHRMDVTMHYFFVPNRLLWPNWEKYITNTMTDGLLPAFPFLNFRNSDFSNNKLSDYLGLPTTLSSDDAAFHVSALPYAAYQCIYNEYYRDQNLIDEVDFVLNDGANTGSKLIGLSTLRNRAWAHDYFTGSLPWPQKGAAVDLPLAQFNDVPVKLNSEVGGDPSVAWAANTVPGGTATNVGALQENNPDMSAGTLWADTSDLVGQSTTINDLRRAFRLQEWLEKAARGGSRYIENILMHFGVKSSDARLNRPEYIVGLKSPVTISEVLNTTGTTEAPQGNMSGHGISVSQGRDGSYFCEEHGYIMCIMSVMPKPAYQQGIPKHFLKTNDPFEFFWPSFAHIGEQEVYNKELMAFSSDPAYDPNGTFGYVPRYAEYKYMPSRVAGDFRSSLDFWHAGRIFDPATPPTLSGEFVEMKASDVNRIFAVEDSGSDHLWSHVFHHIKAIRPMPKFGTPTF